MMKAKMTEVTWVKSFISKISTILAQNDSRLQAVAGKRLLYAYEVIDYRGDDPVSSVMDYQTDILVLETKGNQWKPRVIVETKLENISTHDAITYSEKSATHKQVHPYLRYGILLGNRARFPLPGRLFRHGLQFDFMVSWSSVKPSDTEFESFIQLFLEEVSASRLLEEIISVNHRFNR